MADQVEELIKEIAAKHGIAVSRDDPILVLQTIVGAIARHTNNAHALWTHVGNAFFVFVLVLRGAWRIIHL